MSEARLNQPEPLWGECPECEGEGKVWIDGDAARCPECLGNRVVHWTALED